MILGEKLRELRESRNYSQKELAKKLNVSPACISKYESGNSTPPPETLQELANIYHVSVDYILGRTSFKHDYLSLEASYYKDYTLSDVINDMISLDLPQRKQLVEVIKALKNISDLVKKLPNKK